MCGRKAHSAWLPIETQAWKVAADKGLASVDRQGRYYFGPLVWIEVGRQARAKSRIIPVHDAAEVAKLPPRNRPCHPHPAARVNLGEVAGMAISAIVWGSLLAGVIGWAWPGA